MNALLVELLLLIAALFAIGYGLGVVPVRLAPVLGVIGLAAVAVVLFALAFGVISGGITVLIALAGLGAAFGFFVVLYVSAEWRRST